MKKLILLLLFIPLVSFGQDLAFIGEKSYPSTVEFGFDNSEALLFVQFIKDNENINIVVKTFYGGAGDPKINGKLVLYLDNGDVIVSDKPTYKDYVDNNVISIYPLQANDIKALINSNLNTVRYTIETFAKIAVENKNRTAKNIDKRPLNMHLSDLIE